MSNIKCSFCERLAHRKQADMAFTEDVEIKYTVAIVQSIKRNGHSDGRTVCYKANGIGYPLKFCPECGKPINEV